MTRKKTLKLTDEYQDGEYTTKIFKVSKKTASHFDNWSSFVAKVDDTHISVNAENHDNVMSDDFLSVGLDIVEFSG